MRTLHEECGVFGVWGVSNASYITYIGLHSLQHRGQEAAGLLTADGEQFYHYRDVGLVAEVFRDKENLKTLLGNNSIGHVRYATSGDQNIRNVQPFLFEFCDSSFGICHNGNLINATTLRRQLEQLGSIFHSSSDSEVLAHLIRRSQKSTFKEQLKESLTQIKGGFTYLVLTQDAMYGAVDPHSLRPLVIGKTKEGGYMMSSESCAIHDVGAEVICSIYAGELAIVNDQGLHIERYTKKERIAISAMEYIYFARPDSNIAQANVHTVRKRLGRRLAMEYVVPDADMVIGVPNSSLSSANGYAEQSGKPYEMGLIKNQYTHRTFIQPTAALREQGVRMKLSAVRGVVEGKKVVLVDDSIVRGTTLRRIVCMLKEAGALEVHVGITSPPFMFPTFYGIDASRSDELIAAHYEQDEICEVLGADSLAYLSEEGLIESVGLSLGDDYPYGGLCLDSFNGDYMAGLGDYRDQFVTSLTPIQRSFLEKRGVDIDCFV